MFLTQIMKHSLFGSFQNSAKRFSGIVMNITAHILPVAVVNPIMSGKLFTNKSIGAVFIRNQIRIFIDKTLYLWGKLGDFVTGHRHSPHRAVAFNGNQYSLLVGAFAAFVFNPLLITGLAAYVFFIQFNHAAKRRQDLGTGVHHLAHRMAQFPCAFLRDANPFGQNDRRDALA